MNRKKRIGGGVGIGGKLTWIQPFDNRLEQASLQWDTNRLKIEGRLGNFIDATSLRFPWLICDPWL